MGMSANQARFLSLTSRQVDLEYRMQQICHRRLRLASELEKIATKYDNALSDRKLFSSNNTMYDPISVSNLDSMGYKVINNDTQQIINQNSYMQNINRLSETDAIAAGYDADHIIYDASEFVSKISANMADDFILMGSLDMSELGTLSTSAITGGFSGNFDGNGYEISNLSINSTNNYVGLFSNVSGTVSNVTLRDAEVISSGDRIGGLAGCVDGGTIDNVAVVDVYVNSSDERIGGVVGESRNGGTVSNSYVTGEVSGGLYTGGMVGLNFGGDIQSSYSDVLVSGTSSVGGLVGSNSSPSTITNSYSTGDSSGLGVSGGLVGTNYSTITSSYSTATVSGATTGGLVGGQNATGNADNSNFWNTDVYAAGIGSNSGTFNAVGLTSAQINSGVAPVSNFTAPMWDTSTNPPTLLMNDIESSGAVNDLEEGLRNGTYSLVREADEYTQDAININNVDYEKVDWRIVPTIDDDLFAANDVDAENEYDSAVEKINSQDKKLQMEQSQVEVEHKAIITQKDAVKNILNKNIESSFKTFS